MIYVDECSPYALAVADSAEEFFAFPDHTWAFPPPDSTRPIRAVMPAGRDALVAAGAMSLKGVFLCGRMFARWETVGSIGTPEEAETFYRARQAMNQIARRGEEPMW